MGNPFEIKSAELMEPKQVAEEFVEDHTEHSKIASYSHTIVWGSRGSGKSMHFKYLEPLAQAWKRDSNFNGDIEKYFNTSAAFIGVYINCRDVPLNREEFRRITSLPKINKNYIHALLERYFTCVIIKRIATVLHYMNKLFI